MAKTHINTSTFDFLNKIAKNNNRDWFAQNKSLYLDAKEDVKIFGEALRADMEEHDEIEKLKLYRIYRDVRFSKDKTPYQDHLCGFMVRATKWRRGGMYFHIQPNDQSFVAGGFWNPNSPDLARIRQDIASDDSYLRDIIQNKTFKKYFGELKGNQVKTAPRGYPKDHAAIDLLRYKQYLLVHHFTDEQVLSKTFRKKVVKAYLAMRPFFDYMSDVLTTNSNGEPLWEE